MSDTPAGGLPSLTEIGSIYTCDPSECATVRGLVDRYALDDADAQKLTAILGI